MIGWRWSSTLTALSPGDVMTLWTMRRREYTNWGSLQFSSSPLRVGKGIEESVFGGQPFILSWGKVSKSLSLPPPNILLVSKKPPGQKWPKTGTDCLDVARDSHSAQGVAGANAPLSSVLTSLPGLEKEAGGSLTKRGTPYYTVCPHVTRHQDRLTHRHSVSYFCHHSLVQVFFFFSIQKQTSIQCCHQMDFFWMNSLILTLMVNGLHLYIYLFSTLTESALQFSTHQALCIRSNKSRLSIIKIQLSTDYIMCSFATFQTVFFAEVCRQLSEWCPNFQGLNWKWALCEDSLVVLETIYLPFAKKMKTKLVRHESLETG